MSELPICDICKKPMTLADCYRCGGKGKVSTFGIFPRVCPDCAGAKQVYRCINYGEHDRIQHPSSRQ